jgi:hypothetical protein
MTESRHISYYIAEYVEYIREQFYIYIEETPVDDLPTTSIERMKQKFENSLKIDTLTSKKYTKILTMDKLFRQPIVHSFILNRDDNTFGQNFVKGDILQADYYFQPFRDRTYGNVFYPESYRATWYRPLPLDSGDSV